MATIGGTSPGDKAAYMNFFDYIVAGGPRDRLITPIMSFPESDNIFLNFEYAYADRHENATDSLIVKISNNCGESWIRIFEGGEDNNGIFATHELMTEPFVPAIIEDWCMAGWGAECVIIDLSEYSGQDNIQIMFESYDRFGNNLYLDNIAVGPLTFINDKTGNIDLKIYPNPTTGLLNIVIPENEEGAVVSIFNAQGAKVDSFSANGKNGLISTDLKKFGNGIFFIHVVGKEYNKIEKVIVN